MVRPERLPELGARLSDGDAIDWTAERVRSMDEEESRLVRELASIDRFIAAVRSIEIEPETVAPAGALTGLRIGSYLVQERVGRGGMGEVYRAWQERSGRHVAIKALFPTVAADPIARRRFLREARLARRVAHPDPDRLVLLGHRKAAHARARRDVLGAMRIEHAGAGGVQLAKVVKK